MEENIPKNKIYQRSLLSVLTIISIIYKKMASSPMRCDSYITLNWFMMFYHCCYEIKQTKLNLIQNDF